MKAHDIEYLASTIRDEYSLTGDNKIDANIIAARFQLNIKYVTFNEPNVQSQLLTDTKIINVNALKAKSINFFITQSAVAKYLYDEDIIFHNQTLLTPLHQIDKVLTSKMLAASILLPTYKIIPKHRNGYQVKDLADLLNVSQEMIYLRYENLALTN